MNTKVSKIGFSGIGGVFVDKNIKSEFHKHYAVSIIISFGKPFKLTTSDNVEGECKLVLIQKNIGFSLETAKDDYVAFIHVMPHSDAGIRLSDIVEPIKELDDLIFEGVLKLIKDWFYVESNEQDVVREMLHLIAMVVSPKNKESTIDQRIFEALDIIMTSEDDKIFVAEVATKVDLSVSHFNRLFKKETGLSFRRFVLHSRLIRSISAISENDNLTTASFEGGFSDYEENRKKRLGDVTPTRIKYKKLIRD